jgi:hypothetical protein
MVSSKAPKWWTDVLDHEVRQGLTNGPGGGNSLHEDVIPWFEELVFYEEVLCLTIASE